MNINGKTVPFGIDLLFACSNVPDLIVGVEICEDLWVPIPPSSLQALYGATVLVNLSASNELIGKANYRRSLVTDQSARCIAAYAYASCGATESTTDVVFGGHCLIAENGSLLSEGKRFERGDVMVTADVDLERMRIDRVRTNSFGDSILNLGLHRQFRKVEFYLPQDTCGCQLKREVDAHPFVPRGAEKLKERCEEIFNIQVAGLAKRLEHLWTVKCNACKMREVGPDRVEWEPGQNGCTCTVRKDQHVTIGVSGGLDSTLALIVACKTADRLGVPRANIRAYTMPGFGTTKRTKNNAHALMKQLGVTPIEVDIRYACIEEMRLEGYKPFGIDLNQLGVEVFQKLMSQPEETGKAVTLEMIQHEIAEEFTNRLRQLPDGAQDLRFENTQARARTNKLFNAGFVIGTGDLSELILGWCTYNADHMSAYNPNVSIPKTLVRFLVRWAAEHQFDGDTRATLLDISATEISPELLPTDKEGNIRQKTESVVGPYELTDFFIYHVLRFGMSPQKLLFLARQAKFDTDYSEQELRQWLRTFATRFFSQQFKRSCLPDGPKVGSISVSPRGDLRMPSDAVATLWLLWLDRTEPKKKSPRTVSQPASDNTNGSPATAGSSTERTNMIHTTANTNRAMRVLLRVDILNGFMPKDDAIPGTGELPVTDGPAIVPVVNALTTSGYYDLVVDIQDWHPADHGSFAANHSGKKPFEMIDLFGLQQVLWPVHCVQNTPGADFYPTLDRSRTARVFQKGMDKTVDSYSGFFDNGRRSSTGLADYLRAEAAARGFQGVENDVVGLATDYCDKFTAKDSQDEGFKTRMFMDACRGIGPDQPVIDELTKHGVECTSSAVVLMVMR